MLTVVWVIRPYNELKKAQELYSKNENEQNVNATKKIDSTVKIIDRRVSPRSYIEKKKKKFEAKGKEACICFFFLFFFYG